MDSFLLFGGRPNFPRRARRLRFAPKGPKRVCVAASAPKRFGTPERKTAAVLPALGFSEIPFIFAVALRRRAFLMFATARGGRVFLFAGELWSLPFGGSKASSASQARHLPPRGRLTKFAYSGKKKKTTFNGLFLKAFSRWRMVAKSQATYGWAFKPSPWGKVPSNARRMRLPLACYFRLAHGKIGKPITRSGCKQPERAFAITPIFTLSPSLRSRAPPEGEPWSLPLGGRWPRSGRMRLPLACYFASPLGRGGLPRSGKTERVKTAVIAIALSLASRELIIGFADFPEGEP